MKQKKKRRIYFSAALLACFSLFLGGCRVGNTDVTFTMGLSSNEVFRIGKETVSLPEAKVYLCNYQNIYGNVYGLNLWENDDHREDLQEYVKEVALSEMTRIVAMAQMAREKDISLTEEEQSGVELAAETYYGSLTEEERSYMEVRQSTIEGLYEDYALAQKVYETLTTGVDREVSDDEARVMEAYVICVKDQNRAAEVQAQLNSGRDFLSVAADYNEAAETERTFGRGELPPEVDDVAFQLENDQVSEGIGTEEGYYFLKCINKFDQELTDKNKVQIVKRWEKEAFEEEYQAFVAQQSSSLNEDVWEKLELKTDGSITTNSFFEVFDRYYGGGEE